MNPTDSASALSQLQQQEAAAQNPNDILQSQNQALGVNSSQDTVKGLRGSINNTTKLLQQVAPSVMGRTGSSLVTNAQATKQISNEQAPISQNLTNETDQYNQANTDLQKLQQQAQTAASGIYTGQQDKLSYLQNVYNTLYQKEQDAAAAQRQAAQDAESTRQFNASLAAQQAAAKASAAGASPTLGGSTGGLPQGMSYKNGSSGSAGFNFSLGGAPISAAKYAQVNGGDLRNVLLNMANSGDKTAGQALSALTKSGGKWTPQIQSQFPSLFWGV